MALANFSASELTFDIAFPVAAFFDCDFSLGVIFSSAIDLAVADFAGVILSSISLFLFSLDVANFS